MKNNARQKLSVSCLENIGIHGWMNGLLYNVLGWKLRALQ
jgi:hypothetical protein